MITRKQRVEQANATTAVLADIVEACFELGDEVGPHEDCDDPAGDLLAEVGAFRQDAERFWSAIVAYRAEVLRLKAAIEREEQEAKRDLGEGPMQHERL